MYGGNYYGQQIDGVPLGTVSLLVTKSIKVVYNILNVTVSKTLMLLYKLAAQTNGRDLFTRSTIGQSVITEAPKDNPSSYT